MSREHQKLAEDPKVRTNFYLFREGISDEHELATAIDEVDLGWTWERLQECDDPAMQKKIIDQLCCDTDMCNYLSASLVKYIAKDLEKAIEEDDADKLIERLNEL